MAWLFLDTHAVGDFRLGWLRRDGTADVKSYAGKAHRLLPTLSRITSRRSGRDPDATSGHHTTGEIDGICVVAGPGSFSSVRSGVLDANLLARLWRVPLTGVSVDEAQDLPKLAQRLASESARGVAYVAPLYDAEPNITVRVC